MVFSKESVLHIRWSKYWSFSFSISPSNEYSGLISFIYLFFLVNICYFIIFFIIAILMGVKCYLTVVLICSNPKANWASFHVFIGYFREGNGTLLQYFCLENPMDGGAWWAAVHGVARIGHDWATSLSLFTFMHWRRKWQPTPVFLPGESQGRESLVDCCLWGRTESDTTEAT